MTQVSRFPLRKEIQERMFEVFLDSIALVKTREHVRKLLDDVLSPSERTMLAKRLSIALLLYKGSDQRAICSTLKVSLGTVNRVSAALQKGSGGYAMVLSAIMKNDGFREFIATLGEDFVDIFTSGRKYPNVRRALWESKMRRQKPF